MSSSSHDTTTEIKPTATVVTYTGSHTKGLDLSSISHGRYSQASSLYTELVTIDTFWKRGSHCLELCTYCQVHQVAGVSPEPMVTLMFLVKHSSSQNKMNTHEDEKKDLQKRRINRGTGKIMGLEWSVCITYIVKTSKNKFH